MTGEEAYDQWLAKLPQPDDAGIHRDADGRRWVLDGNIYRMLPYDHGDLNPFGKYRPVKPFKFIDRPIDKRYRKSKRRLIDANGVFLNTNGTIRRNSYKDAASFFKSYMAATGNIAKPQKLYMMLVDPMRGDEVAKDFFDADGKVLPQKFKPFYQYLCQKLATDDRSVTAFWRQLRDKWHRDPMATFEWMSRLFPTDAIQLITGSLTTIGSIVVDASDDKAAELQKIMSKVVQSRVIDPVDADVQASDENA